MRINELGRPVVVSECFVNNSAFFWIQFFTGLLSCFPKLVEAVPQSFGQLRQCPRPNKYQDYGEAENDFPAAEKRTEQSV